MAPSVADFGNPKYPNHDGRLQQGPAKGVFLGTAPSWGSQLEIKTISAPNFASPDGRWVVIVGPQPAPYSGEGLEPQLRPGGLLPMGSQRLVAGAEHPSCPEDRSRVKPEGCEGSRA